MSRSRSPSRVDVSNLCDDMMQMILIMRDCWLLGDCPRELGISQYFTKCRGRVSIAESYSVLDL